jgi:hypothetical protein
MPLGAATLEAELKEAVKVIGHQVLNSRRIEEVRRVKRIDQKDCSYPEVSRLIELFGFNFLIETLQLEDEIFSSVYPNIPLGCEARRTLERMITKHFRQCVRCRLISENHKWADDELASLFKQASVRYRIAGQGR